MLAKIIIIHVKYLHCIPEQQQKGVQQPTKPTPTDQRTHPFNKGIVFPPSIGSIYLSIAQTVLLLRETLICHCCRYNLNSNQLLHYFRLKSCPSTENPKFFFAQKHFFWSYGTTMLLLLTLLSYAN